MFTDFEDFKLERSYFIRRTDKVIVTSGNITISPEFEKTFPVLNNLMRKARVLDVALRKDTYKLYSWTAKDGLSCGWLCKIEAPETSNIEILPEHQLLLDNIGGIRECFNEPEDAFTNNQNFLFIKSECKRGLDWIEYYYESCRQNNLEPIPVDNLVSFVHEANGAETLYHIKTRQIYLFSHDHCFDYVTFVEGQPEYTFHYINGVSNFIDYVETLASQWRDHIEL
jgi:hypothetical protein